MLSEYIGAGPTAALIAQFDQIEIERRALERAMRAQRLAQIAETTAPPVALLDHAQIVADLVRQVYLACGYHQHKRQWRKRRMTQLSTTPTRQDINDLVRAALATGATPADQEAVCRAMAAAPEAGRAFDLAERAITAMVNALPADPVSRLVQLGRVEALRSELSGSAPTVIERLLIDQVILSYLHLNMIEYQQSRLWEDRLEQAMIEFWERRLDGAQRRYTRAVLALAQARRLLRLPTVQINIADQQVNIAGEVRA